MTVLEWSDALEQALAALPQEDRAQALSFYTELAQDRMEEGVPEEEAVAALPAPEEAARQAVEITPMATLVRRRRERGKPMSGWALALVLVGSPLWISLGAAALAVMLAVYLVIWTVALVLWCVVLACGVGLLAGLLGGAVMLFTQDAGVALAGMGCGFVCGGVAVLFFLLARLATLGIVRGTAGVWRGMKLRMAGIPEREGQGK